MYRKFTPELTNLCIYPSFECNYNCLQCGFDLAIKQNEERKETLTSENLKSFLEGSPRLKCTTLTGGEPMLLKELKEITRVLVDGAKPEHLVTITNGSKPQALGKFIDVALDSDIDSLFIGVSIDGLGSICDEIRAKGSYELAIKALELINERREGDSRVIPVVSFTILPENHMELLKMFYLALTYQTAFNYRIAAPYDKFVLTEEMLNEIERQQNIMIGMMERAKTIGMKNDGGVFPVINFNERYIQGVLPHYRKSERSSPCKVPWLNIQMDPYGDIYPCSDAPWMTGNYGNDLYKIGNIEDGNLRHFFSSERRKEVAGLLSECNRCWVECRYHTSSPEYLEGLKIFRP